MGVERAARLGFAASAGGASARRREARGCRRGAADLCRGFAASRFMKSDLPGARVRIGIKDTLPGTPEVSRLGRIFKAPSGRPATGCGRLSLSLPEVAWR